jgi:hypothetical protein
MVAGAGQLLGMGAGSEAPLTGTLAAVNCARMPSSGGAGNDRVVTVARWEFLWQAELHSNRAAATAGTRRSIRQGIVVHHNSWTGLDR